jgi:hypothetical protein
MKKRLFVSATILAILSSCEKKEEALPLTDSYNIIYMNYPGVIAPGGTTIVYLEYSHDKVVKRTGGLVSLPLASGFDYLFTGDLIENLVYSGNKISITHKLVQQNVVTVFKDERTLFVDPWLGIIMEINNPGNPSAADTTDYFYNTEGLLAGYKTHGQYINSRSQLYFNSKENLDSIITYSYSNQTTNNNRKIVETFTDYDNAPNPLKHLIIFKETFYRALCKNNYQEYHMRSYDLNNNLTGRRDIIGKLRYDENGIPVYNPEEL